MKFGKVAICISGGIENKADCSHGDVFRKFFSTLNNYDVFYFNSAWKPNNYHVGKDFIYNTYQPKAFKNEECVKNNYGVYGFELYGTMMANELKKRYEIEKDFRYDLVIKTTWNNPLYTNSMFPAGPLLPRTVYSIEKYSATESVMNFEHGVVNDNLYWGDSQSMDIAANLYRTYKFDCLTGSIELLNGKPADPGVLYFDKNGLLYNNLITHNIGIQKVPLW